MGDEPETSARNDPAGLVLPAALPEAWARPQAANDLRTADVDATASSRAMRGFHYDAATRVLRVEWSSGNVYELDDVPAAIAEGLADAKSKGRYFQDWLRDRYPFRKIS